MIKLRNRLGATLQLHTIELCAFPQQWWQAAPLAESRQRLRGLYLLIASGEANHVPAAAAAITIEQVFERIHQKAWFVIFVQRTQSHESSTAEPSGRAPIIGLQIVQQRKLLFQLVEGLTTHGLLASIGRIRQ